MTLRSFLIGMLLVPTILFGQEAPAPDSFWEPDRAEPGSVKKIREYTTEARFLPETVAYVPDSDTVPSPADVLGRITGTPGELSKVA